MMKIDMPKFVHEVSKKYIIQNYAKGFTGTLKFSFDGGAWLIKVENSALIDVFQSDAETQADLIMEATDEQWDKILSMSPPPFYNSIYIASMYHGIKWADDILHSQYLPFIDELIRQLRAFVNNYGFEDVDPEPQKPNVRFEEVTGHYVYLTIDGIEYRVYYEEAGQGVPFLLQHTAGANGQEYRYLLNDPDFTKDFRFIAYDLPFHGKSLPPENYPWWKHEYKLTLDFYLKFFDAFIDALKLDRPAYMGCSMGGHLAPDLAYYRPEKLRAVVGIGAGLITARETKAEGRASATWQGMQFRLNNPQISGMMVGTTNEAIVALEPYSTPNSQKEVYWDYANAAPGIFAGDCYYYSFEHNLEGKAQDIDTSKCMLYLLTGTYDPGTPPSITQDLADQVKGCKLEFMEGVGHYAMLEAYPTFKKYFSPFAEEIKTLK